ncbi:Uncharacterised protein [Bordetella pertussis]|nr:Uncharacterised protein [Bordetella pertussis]
MPGSTARACSQAGLSRSAASAWSRGTTRTAAIWLA